MGSLNQSSRVIVGAPKREMVSVGSPGSPTLSKYPISSVTPARALRRVSLAISLVCHSG